MTEMSYPDKVLIPIFLVTYFDIVMPYTDSTSVVEYIFIKCHFHEISSPIRLIGSHRDSLALDRVGDGSRQLPSIQTK